MKIDEYVRNRLQPQSIQSDSFAQIKEFQTQEMGALYESVPLSIAHFSSMCHKSRGKAFFIEKSLFELDAPENVKEILKNDCAVELWSGDPVKVLPKAIAEEKRSVFFIAKEIGSCRHLLKKLLLSDVNFELHALDFALEDHGPNFFRQLKACNIRYVCRRHLIISSLYAARSKDEAVAQEVNTIREQDNENLIHSFLQKSIKSSVRLKGSNNFLYLGINCRLEHAQLQILGNNNVLLVQNGAKISGQISIRANNCYISIGKNCSFTNTATQVIVQEDNTHIFVGDNCLVGHSTIRASDSHSIMCKDTQKRINIAESINIGDNVWIAQGIFILKGVNICSHAIIGAGAVVVKSLEKPYAIYAGNPARLIKENVYWRKERV